MLHDSMDTKLDEWQSGKKIKTLDNLFPIPYWDDVCALSKIKGKGEKTKTIVSLTCNYNFI